jgi:hypothetical protein
MAVQRVDIGFIGGQILTVRLEDEGRRRLRDALAAGSGWHDLASEDGEIALDLGKVAYVRLDSGEHRVGFNSES